MFKVLYIAGVAALRFMTLTSVLIIVYVFSSDNVLRRGRRKVELAGRHDLNLYVPLIYVLANPQPNPLAGLYMTIGVAFWYYPGANLPISLTTC